MQNTSTHFRYCWSHLFIVPGASSKASKLELWTCIYLAQPKLCPVYLGLPWFTIVSFNGVLFPAVWTIQRCEVSSFSKKHSEIWTTDVKRNPQFATGFCCRPRFFSHDIHIKSWQVMTGRFTLKNTEVWLWTLERLIKIKIWKFTSPFVVSSLEQNCDFKKKTWEPWKNPADSPRSQIVVGIRWSTRIGPGGSFGELALLYFAPRAATVEAGRFSLGCVGVPQRFTKNGTPKKGGSNFGRFFKACVKDFWAWIWGVCWFLIELCVFVVQDGFGRQLMIPRFGSLIEATAIWRQCLERGSRDDHGSIFTDIHGIHPLAVTTSPSLCLC